ncbi:MAG: hypothetical protein K6G17_00290 [Oscillospiraceae bacterium]|nr:hypothetical protein [Oscillospiraceae bacterium]
MFVRMTYDRSFEEITAALRASARPWTLDNYARSTSTVLYRMYGRLVTLHFLFSAKRVRFCAFLRPTENGGTKLVGAYGFAPFEPDIVLSALLMLTLVIVPRWKEPAAAVSGVLIVLLSLLVLFLLFQLILRCLLGKDKESILRFLQDIGK